MHDILYINKLKKLKSERGDYSVTSARSRNIEVKCFDSISEIDKNIWDSINTEGDIFHSHKFLSCMEKSGIEDSRYWYLIFFEKDRPVGSGVLSLFSVSLDLLSNIAISGFCNSIRKHFPGFMRIKILFCGTPISIGKNNLKISDKGLVKEILNSLENKMILLAKENRVNLLCLKEFDDNECESLNLLSADNFIKAYSLPYVKLYLDKEWHSFDDYLRAMRSPFRRQIKHSLKKLEVQPYNSYPINNSSAVINIKRPAPEDASVFYKLYSEVMKNAKNKLEVLNKNFFDNIFKDFNEQSSLICLTNDEKILGSALVFREKDIMTFLLIGFDYTKSKIHDTYFNIVYAIISMAIKERMRVLEMGQTSYYFKQRCGGVYEGRYFYIKALNKPLHLILSLLRSVLFPEIVPNRLRVFPDT